MIRSITSADRSQYITLCKEFYSGDAVLHPVPEDYFQRTFDALMEHTPYASAYIIEQDGKTAGYALLARSFSQEAGGMVTWIEELYIRPYFQGQGVGTAFFQFLEAQNDGTVKRYRLEYEPDNLRGAALYRRLGFTTLAYGQMIKDI